MIEVEGYKAFRGTMLITPVNPKFPPEEITGDWLYKPIECGYWYCNGRSFSNGICRVIRDDTIPAGVDK